MVTAVAVRRPTGREEGAGYTVGPRPSMRAVRSGGRKAKAQLRTDQGTPPPLPEGVRGGFEKIQLKPPHTSINQ